MQQLAGLIPVMILSEQYLPAISFNKWNGKDTTEPLQQNTIVHARGRVVNRDLPVHGLLCDQCRAPDHCAGKSQFGQSDNLKERAVPISKERA